MKEFAVIILAAAAMADSTHQCSGQGTVYAPLQVFTKGPGRISPLQAGQMLAVWETYSMVAIPDPGFAFHSWEWNDVFITTTRIKDGNGGISTNVEKTVTSKHQFITTPELSFVMRPAFENVHSDVLSTTSTYGWRANFGPVREPVELDVYQTIADASAEESGERVANQRRIVPWSATLTFDFGATPPSLTAIIPNAVLEGGAPFPLTVRSHFGYRLPNGTYRFSGDYLHDIHPTGSQYAFDWEFSTPINGRLVWNGTAFWTGGHLWSLSVSNLTLLQQAQLSIARVGTAAIQASWRTNFSDHVLEYAPLFPAAAWTIVTNAVAKTGNRYAVTLGVNGSQGFYRLRRP